MNQSISIPVDRRLKLLRVVRSMADIHKCEIRKFASMIGSLISVCPAVQYGILYTKAFERQKFLALLDSGGDYSAKMIVPKILKEDFLWWIRVLSDNNQKNVIRSGQYAREIFSDASLSGWGASCGSSSTHGWWFREEKTSHINFLELKAVYYALRCFTSELSDCDILLRIDNTTAISYINRYGSIQYPHLTSLAKEIWSWCEERNIFLFASYIASIDNYIADTESRCIEGDTEWSLSDEAFCHVEKIFGPFDIDLFASMLNAKCHLYVSWIPDPGSFAVDAFTLSWGDFYFFAFPPFFCSHEYCAKLLMKKRRGF